MIAVEAAGEAVRSKQRHSRRWGQQPVADDDQVEAATVRAGKAGPVSRSDCVDGRPQQKLPPRCLDTAEEQDVGTVAETTEAAVAVAEPESVAGGDFRE